MVISFLLPILKTQWDLLGFDDFSGSARSAVFDRLGLAFGKEASDRLFFWASLRELSSGAPSAIAWAVVRAFWRLLSFLVF